MTTPYPSSRRRSGEVDGFEMTWLLLSGTDYIMSITPSKWGNDESSFPPSGHHWCRQDHMVMIEAAEQKAGIKAVYLLSVDGRGCRSSPPGATAALTTGAGLET